MKTHVVLSLALAASALALTPAAGAAAPPCVYVGHYEICPEDLVASPGCSHPDSVVCVWRDNGDLCAGAYLGWHPIVEECLRRAATLSASAGVCTPQWSQWYVCAYGSCVEVNGAALHEEVCVQATGLGCEPGETGVCTYRNDRGHQCVRAQLGWHTVADECPVLA